MKLSPSGMASRQRNGQAPGSEELDSGSGPRRPAEEAGTQLPPLQTQGGQASYHQFPSSSKGLSMLTCFRVLLAELSRDGTRHQILRSCETTEVKLDLSFLFYS